MTFTKGGVDTAMTPVFGADASTNWNTMIFYLALPDTGANKTLSWSWVGISSDDRMAPSVTFWKGVNTAAPVRDSNAAQGAGWPRNTPTLTAALGDKIVAFCGFFYAPGDGAGTVTAWNNLAGLADIANRNAAEGAWATGNPSGNTSVGVQSSTGSEGGIVAIVLKQ